MQKKVLILFLCLSGILVCRAQKILYHHYTTEDGLNDDITYNVIQSKEGYLWIGTDHGLARFDGDMFKNYTTKDGLKSNYVIDLKEDAQQNIWLATWGAGIHRMTGDCIQQVKSIPLQQHSKLDRIEVAKNRVIAEQRDYDTFHCIQVTPDSLVCETKQLYKKRDHFFLSSNHDKPKIPNRHFFLTAEARLWCYGGFPGILELAGDSVFPPKFAHQLNKDTIYSIYEDKGQHYYWFGSKGKLIKMDKDGHEQVFTKNLSGKKITQIQVLSQGKLVLRVGSRKELTNRQVFLYNTHNRQLVHLNKSIPIRSNIAKVFTDKEQNIWITTDGNGLFCLPYPQFRQYDEELNYEFINDIEESPVHTMYFGGKASYYTRKPNTAHFTTVHISESVEDISFTNTGSMLLSGNIHTFLNGIKINNLYCTYQDMVYTSFPSPGYFTFRHHSVFFMNQSDITGKEIVYEIKHFDDHQTQVRNGVIDETQALWVASSHGILIYNFQGIDAYPWKRTTRHKELFFLDKKSKVSCTRLTKEDGLSSNDIHQLAKGKEGEIWAATDQGICVYKDHQFRCFAEKDGLLSNQVFEILVDPHGIVWIGTKKGLCFFDGKQFGSFTQKDGLVSNEVTSLFLDSQQQLWIGGTRGVSVLDVTQKITPAFPPPIYIRQTTINGRQVAQETLLAEYQDVLKFHFGAITFTHPKELKYRIRLNRGEWQVISQRFIEYSALRAGNYTFQVAAKKYNGVWSKPQTLEFTVKPPWWKSRGAIALWVLLLLGGIRILVWWREASQKKKAQDRLEIHQKIVGLELRALQAQMDPHFVFNALNSIQRYILDHNELTANRYLTQFSYLMRLFLESSKSKYIALEQEVELLTLYINLEKLRFKKGFEYTIEVDNKINQQQEIVSMLIQPFVENAINHGLLHKSTPGNLLISFTLHNEGILCIIDDDGVGRKKALEIKENSFQSHESRATQITQERLEAINFIENIAITIDITDKKGKNGEAQGTRVEIFLPLID